MTDSYNKTEKKITPKFLITVSTYEKTKIS